MKKKLIMKDVSTIELDPKGEPFRTIRESLALEYFSQNSSTAERACDYTDIAWEQVKSDCKTWVVYMANERKVVFDMAYVIEAEVDEDDEIVDVTDFVTYYVQPIREERRLRWT